MKVLFALLLVCFITQEGYSGGTYYSQWRWRNDDGDVYTATWKDSANHPIRYRNEGNIRLRRSLVFFEMTGPATVTLCYASDPYFSGTADSAKWTLITNADTGKFFLSDSRYLLDDFRYSDNRLLPWKNNDSGPMYHETVTIDSSSRFSLSMNSNDGYELEYCLKANKNVLEGSVYYFLSFYNGYSWNGLQADPPCIQFPPFYWNYYKEKQSEIEKIQFVDDLNGWCQSDEEERDVLKRTSDGGKTWSLLREQSSLFYFMDKDTGWAVINNSFCKTTDGGLSWLLLDYEPDSIQNVPGAIYFYEGRYGWATFGPGRMLRTTDGGATWEKTNSPNAYIRSMCFVNERVGFAMGESIYKTTDGGSSWRLVYNIYGPNPERQPESAEGVGKARQSDGTMSPMAAYGAELQFVDSSTGWALTYNGKIYQTIDGGEHWTLQVFPSAPRFLSITFADRNKGWVVGERGIIYATKDGGATWEKRPSGTGHHLNTIAAVNDHVWIGSDDGMILSSQTGGWTTAVDETDPIVVPDQSMLYPNYPNPFNPQTTIRYALRKSSHVTIAIYDLLGREVEILVNTQMPAGTHEVRWDASRYSSGVYISRMKAGVHVEARTMAVIK